jgi:hypothetical protein
MVESARQLLQSARPSNGVASRSKISVLLAFLFLIYSVQAAYFKTMPIGFLKSTDMRKPDGFVV